MFFGQSCICVRTKVVLTIFVYMFGLKNTLKDYFLFLFVEPNNVCI